MTAPPRCFLAWPVVLEICSDAPQGLPVPQNSPVHCLCAFRDWVETSCLQTHHKDTDFGRFASRLAARRRWIVDFLLDRFCDGGVAKRQPLLEDTGADKVNLSCFPDQYCQLENTFDSLRM